MIQIPYQTQNFESMLLTHYMHGEIDENLNQILKDFREETNESNLTWHTIAFHWFYLNQGYNQIEPDKMNRNKEWFENQIKPKYPTIHDLIMLDVFG